MSSIADLISELARLDIRLALEGEALRINGPAGRLPPELIARLKARKPALIEFLRQHQAPAPAAALTPLPRPERLPLSYAQQRLWFLGQLEGGSRSYNIPLAVRLHGPLDVAALAEAWRRIELRHEVLRTTFAESQGQAWQQLNPPAFALQEFDFSALPAAAREAALLRLVEAQAAQVFDLARGPLWRVALARLGELEHALLVTMHHSISDGWSIGILTRELSALYARQIGRPAEDLPPLALQYADFAVWQRDWLQGEVLARELAYWKQRLDGAPARLPLATDRPRPPLQSHAGDRLLAPLPPALSGALKRFAQAHDATLFMVLQAAFAVLLARYTRQDDICIGTPIANRQVAEVEPLVGFFVNTLVLRNDLSGEPGFRALLERVRRATLDAYQHQAVPFELVVEALQPERNLSYSPLFQVMFVLQNNRQEALSLGDARLSPLEGGQHVAKFDLSLTVWENGDELTPAWTWATDLFERATIERMAGHYQRLLEGLVAAPDQPVTRLPLLGPDELRQVLVEWNDTAADYPADRCLHQLFEAQAARTPEAPAVADGSRCLSYRELDARAHRLARLLVAQGVGPDVLVGLHVERCTDLVVGLLGILKAGGAYLPLDPAYPAERLAAMRQDARLRFLVTQAGLRGALAPGPEQVVEMEQLDAPEAPAGAEPGTAVPAVTPAHLAYVIYTSGSTGQPKGVEVTHQGLVNYLSWCIRAYPVAAGSGIPVNGSFSFDGTVPALLAPLLVGRQVSLLAEEQQFDLLSTALRQAEQPFSLVKGTPTHLNLLHRLLERPAAPLRTHALVLGGEALPRSLLDTWWAHAPHSRVFNQYGPTEATVACCWYEARPGQGASEVVPIGRPVANTQVYLLDGHGQPVPIGVPGELYVGGVQVARGYLHRPELTAERFVANPFGPGRLYRTGDLCRYLGDGNIEYLGRIDQQVKVNGVRIELGEIEAQLHQCAGVTAAAVVVSEASGGKRLVAYVAGSASAEQLRAELGQRLPAFLVPARLVALPSLPLTPNGKLDRKALPEQGLEPAAAAFVAPRTPVETLLAAVWQDALRLERVGVTDNFFQVGGDSILSIQIVSRARAAGLQLSPRDLFQHQTIAELAAVARAVADGAGGRGAEQAPVAGPLPLTPIQRRFFEQAWSEPHHFNQSMLLELDPRAEPAHLETALGALLRHHDALRTRFVQEAQGWQASIDAPDAAPVPRVPVDRLALSHLADGAWQAALEERAHACQASLDLGQGPLLRALLVDRGPRRLLLLAIHHLVVDGVSWRILLEDLQTAYRQAADGQAVELPAKTLSFAAWARLLQDHGPGAVAGEQAHWAGVRAEGVPALPVDHRLGPNDHASAAVVTSRLGAADTAALLHEAPAAYHTRINDLLLTALLLAYWRWSGQEQLLLSLEGHGREDLFDGARDVDVSRTVGWFTALFPVRLALDGAGVDAGTAIRQVKEQLRAVPRRGVGYGLLRYLDGADGLAIEPGLVFNYLGQFDQSVGGGLVRALAPEDCGPARSPAAPRAHLLDLTCLVAAGQLEIALGYSRNLHQASSIQRLADHFRDSLGELIAHCRAPGAGGHTPSDFPEAALDQAGLDRLLQAVARANPDAQAPHRCIEAIHPLSPSQQGMLVETLGHPGSGVHVEQSVLSWHGALDKAAFEQAWQGLLARHTSLRSGFAWEDLAEPLQFVLRRAVVPVTRHDLRGLPAEAQRQHVARYVAQDRRRGFSPMAVPLMRVALFEAGEDTHHFVWTRHHILSDGWSLSVMTREFMALYQAACTGQPAGLAPARPYHAYLAWLRAQDPAASAAFWREYLAGCGRPVALGGHAGAPDAPGGHATTECALPAAASARLAALGRQHGLTTSTLVQAAWALVLHQLSGARELVFGATVSGRPAEVAGVEDMVGLFINSVPVCVRLPQAGGGSLVDWLRSLQAQALAQLPHGHCSTGQIQQWSGLPAGQALYDSLLVFENYPVEPGRGGAGPSITPLALDGNDAVGARTRYALTLLVLPGAALRFRFVHDRRRLAEGEVAGIGDRLLDLLTRIAEQPGQDLEPLLLAPGQAPLPGPQAVSAPERPAPVPPCTEAERQLLTLWQELLGSGEAIGIQDSFFDLGGHSLVALRLMARIQQRFQRNLPLASLLQNPTVESLARLLDAPAASAPAEWPTVVPIQPRGEGQPFFCVPGSGGNPLYLHDLARLMGTDRPVYGLQAVGLDGTRPPHATVEAAAAHNIEALRRVQPQGPYLLGGHSFGGKVAFEMGLQLHRAGQEVAGVVLLDVTAPSEHQAPPPPWDEARWLVALADAFAAVAGRRSRLDAQALRALEPQAQLLGFKAELECLELLPAGSDPRQARGWVEVFKSNLQTRYRPEGFAPIPLVLFRAEEALAPAGDQGPAPEEQQDPWLGWRRWSRAPVEVVPVPGSHLTMLGQPHVAALARELRGCLRRLEERAVDLLAG